MAQLVKNLPAMQETPVRFLGQEDLLERDRLPTPVFLGFLFFKQLILGNMVILRNIHFFQTVPVFERKIHIKILK